jgi:hypothetical protein
MESGAQSPTGESSWLFNESTTTWWWSMVSINAVHALLLSAAVSKRPPRDAHERWLRVLAVTYLVGCTWRSTFPVLWESSPHGCLFKVDDTMLIGGELVDQLFSQCAETSIAVMFAMKTGRALRASGSPHCAAVASRSYWLIAYFARLCCWYGCSTDNKLFHVLEESSWTLYAATLAACMLISLLSPSVSKWSKSPPASPDSVRAFLGRTPPTPAEERAARWYMIYSVPVCLFYIHFMVRTDVPMYLAAWRADTAAGVTYNSFAAGLREMVRCDQLTTAFEPWREAYAMPNACAPSPSPLVPRFSLFAPRLSPLALTPSLAAASILPAHALPFPSDSSRLPPSLPSPPHRIVWQTGYFAIMPLFTMFAYAYQLSEETATRHLDALIPEAKLEPTLTQLEPDRTSPWSMAARTKAD